MAWANSFGVALPLAAGLPPGPPLSDSDWPVREPYLITAIILMSAVALAIGCCTLCQQRPPSAPSPSSPHIEPLLVNGRVIVRGASSAEGPGQNGAAQKPPAPAYANLLFLTAFGSLMLGSAFGSIYLLIAYFSEIWKSGFVAALLLGGIALGLRYIVVWIYRNILLRNFCTTMQLSRENKESTPVLEWFKVWLPRYMKQRSKRFHNIAPLFRKKDGTTFFTHFQDSRRSDQFALSLWASQGTHHFTFESKDGRRSYVLMHYYTKGEAKKTGWNNELVAQAPRSQTCTRLCPCKFMCRCRCR